MIDILNNGAALFQTMNDYLSTIDGGARTLIIDVWVATPGDGLMEYQDVATNGAGDRIVMAFYFNGVNHFDSLIGGGWRETRMT